MRNLSSSNRYGLAWLAAFFIIVLASFAIVSSLTIESTQSEGIEAKLAYNPISAFDTNNDGMENMTGIIDVTLQNSIFNFTPVDSETCSVWQVYSADTGNSKFYCQGSDDCCSITQAISPINISSRAGKWDVFYLSYNDNNVSTSSNILKAQVWSANSSNLTDIKFSNWTNITAHFSSINQITINLISPADTSHTANATLPIQFSVQSMQPISSCQLISNGTSTQTIPTPQLNTPLEFIVSLPEGSNAWRIKCEDNNQNIVETPSQILNVDLTAPTIGIISPSNNSISTPILQAQFSIVERSPIAACTSYVDNSPTILGNIKAGFPTGAEEELNFLSLDEYLIDKPNSSFLLKVSGDSMEGVGIFDGDMVVIEKTAQARSGNIVLALIDNEWTLKILDKQKGKRILRAANPNYPEFIPTEELKIFGTVKSVMRKY